MRGLNILRKYKVEFNTLSCVNSVTVKHPVKIYKFLKSIGSKYLQFIPIVEREVDTAAAKLGLDFAAPPNLADAPATKENPKMSEFAVPAEAYGDFLIKIFNEWIKRDVGKTYVQLFDVALGKWIGTPGGLCYFSETCGRALAMEHDGNVYTCDENHGGALSCPAATSCCDGNYGGTTKEKMSLRAMWQAQQIILNRLTIPLLPPDWC